MVIFFWTKRWPVPSAGYPRRRSVLRRPMAENRKPVRRDRRTVAVGAATLLETDGSSKRIRAAIPKRKRNETRRQWLSVAEPDTSVSVRGQRKLFVSFFFFVINEILRTQVALWSRAEWVCGREPIINRQWATSSPRPESTWTLSVMRKASTTRRLRHREMRRSLVD